MGVSGEGRGGQQGTLAMLAIRAKPKECAPVFVVIRVGLSKVEDVA